MENTERFSNRVDNYVKYRPTYPKQVITWLQSVINFTEQSIVADIGSGTGISTQLFLQNGNQVFAVEPNGPMREKAEVLLENFPSFISVNGTAENTTLLPESIDLIIAAQAFHWFNNEQTKNEFKRILKPEGCVALIWNERQVETNFEIAYENLLLEYGTDYASVNHRNVDVNKIATFFLPNKFEQAIFGNDQKFDFEGLKGRMLSSSYIPLEKNEKFDEMMADLQLIFDQYEQNDIVTFGFETNVYVGKL